FKLASNMKRLIKILLIVLLVCGYNSALGQSVKHVVLISIDGSRPEFYMDSSWPAPNLQKLKDEGVYAGRGVKSVYPSVTYPSHTTIVTGDYPATHGVYYNIPIDGKPGEWYWNAGAIKSETLWDAVEDAGMTSGAVFWPVTVDAPIDYNFPVRRPEENEKGNLLTIKYPYISPKSLLDDIEKKRGKKFTPDELKQRNYAESKTINEISNYIIKKYKPNLMAIHFVGIDHMEHAHGTEAPEVREILALTDSLVGSVIETIKEAGIWDKTAIIITGDHGHTNTIAKFAPNVYLAEHDLINKNGWKAKFHGEFLYLKEDEDQATLDSVIAILENTPEYKKGAFRILNRETLDTMGVNPNVSLAIAMKAGIKVRNGKKGKTFQVAKGNHSTHGYDPSYPSMYTSFIAAGAGIDEHKDIEGMGLQD